MKRILWLPALAIAICAASCGDNKRAKNFNQQTQVDDDALRFFTTANEADLAEIKTATLAENNSKNARVIEYAKMLIKDHSENQTAMKKLTNRRLVSEVDTISMEHKMMGDSLAKLTGADFDKAYMTMMVKDHQKAIDLYKTAQSNTDKRIINFATNTLTRLQVHLDSAKAINASLK